jgi:catechol 2,3-dioxygenase-like lactoylglutathione lyase family enzyme
MNPRVGMITLAVSDLARSRRFYEEGLGFTPRPESNDSVAFYETGGAWLALYPELAEDAGVEAAGSGFRAFSIAHNEPTKEGVDIFFARAVAAGARVVKATHTTFWGGYTGYFGDPDGFLWEVAWNPGMPEIASA